MIVAMIDEDYDGDGVDDDDDGDDDDDDSFYQAPGRKGRRRWKKGNGVGTSLNSYCIIKSNTVLQICRNRNVELYKYEKHT